MVDSCRVMGKLAGGLDKIGMKMRGKQIEFLSVEVKSNKLYIAKCLLYEMDSNVYLKETQLHFLLL